MAPRTQSHRRPGEWNDGCGCIGYQQRPDHGPLALPRPQFAAGTPGVFGIFLRGHLAGIANDAAGSVAVEPDGNRKMIVVSPARLGAAATTGEQNHGSVDAE